MMRPLSVLLVAAWFSAAPGAQAAQVRVTGDLAEYTAGAAEANRLSIDIDATGATLRDAVAIEGCSAVEGGVRCEGVRRVVAKLGDEADAYAGGLGPALEKGTPDLAVQVFGEGGDDTLIGGDASEVLDGGGGNDHVDGGASGDLVRGMDGDDAILGGDGDDVVADGHGLDRLDAGGGDDELLAFEDSVPERLPCGYGRDVVHPGVNDLPDLDCERVKFCFCPNGAMPPKALAVIRGVATFRVACPTVLGGPAACRGRITLSRPAAAPEGSVLPRAFTARSRRYAITDGQSRLVHVRLPDDVRRAAIAGPLVMRLRLVLDKRTRPELRGEYLVTVRAGD